MTHYIYSTHTNTIRYVEYDLTTNKNHNVVKRQLTVAGGHGLANKILITPEGVVTRVDRDDDMEWLKNLPAFQKDIENGYIRVYRKKEEPEKVVKKDMCLKDGSAPKTPADYKISNPANNSYSSISPTAIL